MIEATFQSQRFTDNGDLVALHLAAMCKIVSFFCALLLLRYHIRKSESFAHEAKAILHGFPYYTISYLQLNDWTFYHAAHVCTFLERIGEKNK